MTQRNILVIGASGIIGRAAIDRLQRSPDNTVIGVSRRPPDLDCHHVPLDLTDKEACEDFCRSQPDITHVIYTALYEKPGLIAGWHEADQMQTNLAMLGNVMEPLTRYATDLRHISLLQGTKAYGAHLRPMKIPGKEREPRVEHENFYWLQEDYIRDLQSRSDWQFTIWRPQVVFGHALGAPMNMLAAIGVFAALQKQKGQPLIYPGGPNAPVEATDADLLASAFEFAMQNQDAVANETFNVTNGDVFEWRNLWPAIAETLGMESGDDDPMLLSQHCYPQEKEWQALVHQHGLANHTIRALVGDSFIYADALFATGSTVAPPPALVSTVKLRQAGFADCIDTEDMLRSWLHRLQS
ncbi:MAG: SDR family oxidoreductase, partial [Pseudomonadales bacterium]|nr:SDR family oxidoreductase [Pseudomonadales bacterium]